MKKEIIVPVVIALLVAGVAGFFGGIKYQQMQRGNFRNGQGGNFMFNDGPGGGGQRGGPNGQGGRGMGFRPTIGEIIASDDKSVTVKMDDGSSKIVLISDTTSINKSDSGSKEDLTTGTKVAVFGQDNNGTVTAQNIQINPMMRTFNNSSPIASPR